MSRSMTVFLVLCCSLVTAGSMFASSLGMGSEGNGAGANLKSSAFKLAGLNTSAAELNAVKSSHPSTLQFKSALANTSVLENKTTGAFSKAKEFRFYISTQCVVDPRSPPPSVVPEPSSIVLFALGLAIITFAAGLRGKLRISVP